MTRSRQLTITSMGADGPAGTRSNIRSRPSAATSNVGGCPARMNDFSNSTTGALYANAPLCQDRHERSSTCRLRDRRAPGRLSPRPVRWRHSVKCGRRCRASGSVAPTIRRCPWCWRCTPATGHPGRAPHWQSGLAARCRRGAQARRCRTTAPPRATISRVLGCSNMASNPRAPSVNPCAWKCPGGPSARGTELLPSAAIAWRPATAPYRS